MNKILGEKVKGYIKYDDRIILVKFSRNQTIQQQFKCICRQQIVATPDGELEDVYENIDKLIEYVKGNKNLVVMGDWNSIVGEEKVNNLTGAYGLEILKEIAYQNFA